MSTLYEILNVTREADTQDIRRAFYKLAKRYHPDVSRNNALFIKILNAYKTLIDDSRRKQYDRVLTGQSVVLPGERIFYAVSLKDIARPNPYAQTNPSHRFRFNNQKGYHICINLTASELISGATVYVDVPAHVICPLCHGHHTCCSFCSDRGYILKAVPVPVTIPEDIRDGEVFRVLLRKIKYDQYAFFMIKDLLIKVRIFQDIS